MSYDIGGRLAEGLITLGIIAAVMSLVIGVGIGLLL
jgi:hypothetical protein